MSSDLAVIKQFVQAAKAAGCPQDQTEFLLGAGIVLQPKQLLASAAAREMDQEGEATELGYGGARGGGKSHWMLAQMVDDCLRYPGLKCLLLRKVGKSLAEGFDDLRIKILARVPHEYPRSEGVLIFPNGSRIRLGHFQNESDIDKYLGLEYDVIGVEEATTLTWAKYQGIKSCCRTSKAGWRPRMYTTTNPGGVGHVWYKNRFVKPPRADQERFTRFIQATIDDNSFINPEYRKSLDELTGWLLRAWRYGDWDIAAGQYFTTFREKVHVPERPMVEIPLSWRVWCSMDYGFVHYTTAYLLAESDDGIVHIVDEHAERRWPVERHADGIRAMLERHRLELSHLYTFVAGSDVFAERGQEGTVASQYRSQGIILTPANVDRINGATEMLKRLGDVDQNVEPSLYISPNCARLIECIPALEHDPHRPEDVLKWDTDDDGFGGDDSYDGARYGLMVAQRKSGYGPNPLAGYRG